MNGMQAGALFFFLRRLRAPLIGLIVAYAVGIAGLVVIPGQDAAGQPAAPMSVFHAFYFMSYTATTIGFGETPNAFTDAQRLWVTFAIYLSVFGWAWLISQLLALMQDRAVLDVLRAERVRRQVRGLREPFFLVCGVGETGARLRTGLDALGLRCVAVDIDASRVIGSNMGQLRAESPGFVADASDVDVLLAAGLRKPQCRAVLALTSDDRANTAVAMAVRLLEPAVPVLARAMTPRAAEAMRAFGTDHIVNPFVEFGRYLTLAMHSPGSYRLLSWLTGLPGTTLDAETHPPHGHWVVCGYGRFGQEVVASLRREGTSVTIVDPDEPRDDEPDPAGAGRVRGTGVDRATLETARIGEATGLVAGTDDDVTNLAIVAIARALNPTLYVILRQNLEASSPLVQAVRADIVMISSEIVAHACLAVLRTPLLAAYLDVVRARDDAWADDVVGRLEATLGPQTPDLWTVRLDARDAPAVVRQLRAGFALRLGELSRDPASRDDALECVPLLLWRAGQATEMPDASMELATGDGVLFAGTPQAHRDQARMLVNLNVLVYVLQGRDVPGGIVWQWLSSRQG